MPYNNIPFKSYCWSLGTTSFRTRQFNKKIEEQLELLQEFFDLPDNKNISWQNNREIQTKYYNFLREKGFLTGNESRPDKFAREKTSGLCELGLIDDNRRLTKAGQELLKILQDCDFSNNNIFKIAKDSFLFTKQMLKLSNTQVDNEIVRPYIVLIYLLSELDYLSQDEFTYLLPLCVNKTTTLNILSYIKLLRNNETDINDIITNIVLSLPNYPSAKELFLNNAVTEDLICVIGMNRKSRAYDKPYYKFYNVLKKVCVDKNFSALSELYETTKQLKLKTLWRDYLFETTSRTQLRDCPQNCITEASIYDVSNENEFKQLFFEKLHLFKIKSNLLDYSDLNKRYFKITDTVIFSNGKVEFDIIPKYFFKKIANNLFEEAFTKNELLYENCEFSDISTALIADIDEVYSDIQNNLGISIVNEDNIQNILTNEKLKRFKELISEKFSDNNLINLLDYFENREDKKIFECVTDNATIPTIFEYILAIIWYKIGEYKGDILKYMNLSLEADLLPKTHACGGEADIIYEYEETEDYPNHSMLIEATLMDESTQRRGEMEPVSRHLGNYILNSDKKAYCTFISPYLDINVLNHFRSLKTTGYYNPQDYSKHVESLKIIPLKTKELKTILQNQIKYKQLYKIFDNAYESNTKLPNWYDNEVVAKVS